VCAQWFGSGDLDQVAYPAGVVEPGRAQDPKVNITCGRLLADDAS